MRAQDIIRAVLDILDSDEQEDSCECGGTCDSCSDVESQEDSRFKQIFAMLDNPSEGPLANSPNEVVADVDSVTTLAGGGLNGPKHPADIRVKDPRGFE
jgi:hypothetical protein